MAGIYIHIPFCTSRCCYCDFYSGTDIALKSEVIRGICRELSMRSDFLGKRTVETIYFGGGTPSLCSPEEITELLSQIRTLFPVSSVAEITLEVNPDDLTASYLVGLRNAGINRLSIGIQSFIDRDLQWMNRRHDAHAARKAVEMARAAGFDNLSIDLIYGLPVMTSDAWGYNLDEAIALSPEHISAYHLTYEPGTKLGKSLSQGKVSQVDDEISQAEYLLLHRKLSEAGYEHYEISNFALPGRCSRHNSSYWQGKPYLGVGPAAHSYDGAKERYWNISNTNHYLEGLRSDTYFEKEELTVRDRYNEYVMTSLRCDAGVIPDHLLREFGQKYHEYFLREAETFIQTGALQRVSGHYCIPVEAYLSSDAVISSLFWAE